MTDHPDKVGARVFGLDVLRALAIASVLFSHLHMSFWGAGSGLANAAGILGVELFFVLSGFLIGGLLLDILAERPTVYAWRVFLVRRWLRTLPLYFFWMAVLLLVWPSPRPEGLPWSYFLLTQNLAWPMSANWFPVSWSLMVEEWFYLLFASLLLALAHWLPARRAMAISCALFLLVPLALRFAFDQPAGVDWGENIRKVVVMRLDAIAYGVIAAVLYRHRRALFDRFWLPALVVGLLLVLAASITSAWPDAYRSLAWRALFFSVLTTGFALCFPAALRMPVLPTPLRQLVMWTSQRSYGLYLVHLTVMETARHAIVAGRVPLWLGFLIACVVPLVIADLCYRWLEKPVLAMRPRQASAAFQRPVLRTPSI